MQELLPAGVELEIFKVLLGVELYKMYFVGLLDMQLNKRICFWSQSKQQASIILLKYRQSNILKLVKNAFLTFDTIDELCDINHRISVYELTNKRL